MSCHIPLLLPKWRQGTGQKFISQTTVAIKLKVPHCAQCFSLSPLLKINGFGAGAVAILFDLGVSGIQPAQANFPNRQAMRLEQIQAELPNDLDQSRNQKNATASAVVPLRLEELLGTAKLPHTPEEYPKARQSSDLVQEKPLTQQLSQKVAVDPSPQGPTALSVVVLPKSTPVSLEPPVEVSTQDEIESNVGKPIPPPVLATSRSNFNLGWERSPSASQSGCTTNKTCNHTVPSTTSVVPPHRSTPALAQLPSLSPTPPLPVPVGVNNSSNPMGGQWPYVSQSQPPLPMPAMVMPMGVNGYNPTGGQLPYVPQTVILVPVPAMAMPMGVNGYNPTGGQYPYVPQTIILVPVPAMAMPMGVNSYNPTGGQYPYLPQTPASLSAPVVPNPVGFSHYNPSAGQSAYGQQTPAPLPAPLTPNPVGFSHYYPTAGQSIYGYGQQTPAPQNPIPLGSDSYYPTGEQSPSFQQTLPQVPNAPNPNLVPQNPIPTRTLGEEPPTQPTTLTRNTAVTESSLQLQGIYINIGDQSSARARLSGLYPLNSQLQFGATLDLITGEDIFADSRGEGLNINELYLAAAPFKDLPNLRFVIGQLDLTSYFDRNSFAKDGARDFFSPIFQTNPALSTTGISSRPGVLVNWTLTDNIEAKAAVFSSARNMGDFSLDGFAGEIGIRYGNAIIRGTYASARDAGSRDGFREIFQTPRGINQFGLLPSDREESYGINAEVFIPQLNMGLFGRYGRYENNAIALEGDTYSIGLNVLDLFTQNDRLGLAYGRSLSNDRLRRENGDKVPDVLELFYDFRFLPNVRLGFTLQERNGFSETIGGFRIKTEFDVTPRGGLTR